MESAPSRFNAERVLMLNFHACIASTDEISDDTYLNNLDLRLHQRAILREARRLVRDALRKAFAKETAVLFGNEAPISPRFFTQGSWGYQTINRPTHIPPQQTDMDDGCFLPMSFVRGATPRRAADWFFSVADRALMELVQTQRWNRCDSSKPTCCRIIIDTQNHIDVPLYAIRDEQFVAMKNQIEFRHGVFREAIVAASEDNEYALDWTMITDEDVLLAKRDGKWCASNPMHVTRWALSATEQNGIQLRRIWRAIKGWRDQMYSNGGGPSSICLMVIVEADFKPIAGRDDLALQVAAASIRQRILKSVLAPWPGNEDLNRLSADERQQAASLAAALEQEIETCIQGVLGDADRLLIRLGRSFGIHFSADASRVKEVSARDVVKAYPVTPAVIPSFRGNNRSA